MLHGLILRVACKLGMCNIVALSVTFEGCRLTKKRGVVNQPLLFFYDFVQ